MPEMISIGWPRASRARSRNTCLRCASRSALVPTTRTLSACMSRRRWPKRSRQAMARAATSLSMRPFSSTPGGQAHHLAQAVDDDELAVRVTRDHHVETVGAQVHRRQNVGDRAGLRSGGGSGLGGAGGGGRRHEAQERRVRRGEGGTAAAGGARIGIADHELRALQVLAIVDLGPGQVLHAHRVDEQLHALVLDAGVPVLQLPRRTRSRTAGPSSRRPARTRAA